MSALKSMIVAASALATTLVIPSAHGQGVTSSGPLGQLNPWGVGWIGAHEGALPATLWDRTEAKDLAPLLQTIQPAALTPMEQDIIRRVVLSGGRAPGGSDTALALQRIRLLESIGAETEALDLQRRFSGQEWARDPAEIETDQDFGSGNTARACGRVDSSSTEDAFWVRSRIACLLIAGDAPAAALTADIARSADIQDPWLFTIAEAANRGEDAMPPARFDSGIATAISLSQKLHPPVNAMDAVSVSRAAEIAKRQDLTPVIRRQAAMKAALHNALSDDLERSLLLQSDDDSMAGSWRRVVDSVSDPELDLVNKTAPIFQALKNSEGDPRMFALASRILMPEIRSIPVDRDTKRFAARFVRASIAAGDLGLARRWRDAMDISFNTQDAQVAAPAASAFSSASVDTDLAEMVEPPVIAPPQTPEFIFSPAIRAELDVMLAIADEAEALNNLSTALDILSGDGVALPSKQLHQLRIVDAMGFDLSAKTRRALSAGLTRSPPQGGTTAAEILRMESAARSGALGEAMMRAVRVLRSSRSGEMSDSLSIGRVIAFLNTHGQGDLADQLALEAIGLTARQD